MTAVDLIAVAGVFVGSPEDPSSVAPLPIDAAFARNHGVAAALADAEIAVLYPLVVARLSLNAASWASRRGGPADSYGRARSRHTWSTLAALTDSSPTEAEADIRSALAVPPKHARRKRD